MNTTTVMIAILKRRMTTPPRVITWSISLCAFRHKGAVMGWDACPVASAHTICYNRHGSERGLVAPAVFKTVVPSPVRRKVGSIPTRFRQELP